MSRSLTNLGIFMDLFAMFRINGSIDELIGLLKENLSVGDSACLRLSFILKSIYTVCFFG